MLVLKLSELIKRGLYMYNPEGQLLGKIITSHVLTQFLGHSSQVTFSTWWDRSETLLVGPFLISIGLVENIWATKHSVSSASLLNLLGRKTFRILLFGAGTSLSYTAITCFVIGTSEYENSQYQVLWYRNLLTPRRSISSVVTVKTLQRGNI